MNTPSTTSVPFSVMAERTTSEPSYSATVAQQQAEVKVTCWIVKDGVYTPQTYRIIMKDGVYEKRYGYLDGRWCEWRSEAGTNPGRHGQKWMLCEPDKQELLELLFWSSHRCGSVIDNYRHMRKIKR